jgi:hypothetical protein
VATGSDLSAAGKFKVFNIARKGKKEGAMKPTIGRIVHFVQKRPEVYGDRVVHLPAIIVSVHAETCVNLKVFTDGTNSDPAEMSPVKWITSAQLDETNNPQPYTWHWPERE